jgi:hypothetical protein
MQMEMSILLTITQPHTTIQLGYKQKKRAQNRGTMAH